MAVPRGLPHANPIRGLRHGGTANYSTETLGFLALLSHRPARPADEIAQVNL